MEVTKLAKLTTLIKEKTGIISRLLPFLDFLLETEKNAILILRFEN